ncbi:MAG: Ig-like domain-containing protein [Lachnospiraceae bacterium]|nr:Ig-like domain-containing protein [Lachnospiraceae bacterium]
MKKLMCILNVFVAFLCCLLGSVKSYASTPYWDLEDSIAYVDENGTIWFKEFATSNYKGDYIKWSVRGEKLVMTADFSETYYYDEYENDNYFRIRMYNDADDYTDGIDWLIYQYQMYAVYSPATELDMSKYEDGKYVIYYDVDCCAYEECYMLKKNGEIYIQPWDRAYKYQHVENYNKLMEELNEVDVSQVVSDFKKSRYSEKYDGLLGEDMRAKAQNLTSGIKTDYKKARAIYDYVTENKSIRGETEANRLYGAMLNYIEIPTVYIGNDAGSFTSMVASYIEGKWIINTVPAPHTNETTYVNVIAGGFDLTPIGVLDEMLIARSDLEVDNFIYVGCIDINEGAVYLKPGKTTQVTVYVQEERLRNEPVKWWTSNTDVATVDDNGIITAVAPGITSIYVEVDGWRECEYVYVKDYPEINVTYNTHIQSYGWECDTEYGYYDCYDCGNVCPSNGEIGGTIGEGKRLEGIKINVESGESYNDVDLGIRYTTHCQSYGWLPWSSNGDMSGTEGESKRLEAIMIELTGEDANKYDIYYRVHAQSYGWLAWARNGAPAGTAGYGKRLEAIQIVVVKKGEYVPETYMGITPDNDYAYVATVGTSPVVNHEVTDSMWPEVTGKDTPNVIYRTHVQTYGWQGWRFNGQMSGTSGQSKRLEGIEIDITNKNCAGDVIYTTHVQTYGWQRDLNDKSTWSTDGEMSGTSGEAKRLEAICIDLTEDMKERYDIYYRVHAQSYGWLGWAKNSEAAGTAGYGKRLEGIQIVLVPKGGMAPGNYGGIVSDRREAYVER